LPPNIKQRVDLVVTEPYTTIVSLAFQNLSEDLIHNFWGNEDFSMGNLKEKSFYAIWYGERFRSFREKYADPANFPMCHHCDSDFSKDVFLTGLLKHVPKLSAHVYVILCLILICLLKNE
jgi:hypothetical protein